MDILERVRLSRIRAMEVGVLSIIIVIAILIRVQPLQYGAYFTAYDPDFQYRATKYVAENGFASWWTWHDTLSWYPMGRSVATSAYPGIPFSGAFVYMVANALGLDVSVFTVGLYFPILMACLTCILSYYLGKELSGRAAGLFTALFMAINPAFIARSTFGFYDTENIGIFAMVAISLFFLRSLDEGRALERRAAYGVLSGLSLGYLYASWGAARYMTGLLVLYMLIMLYTERFQFRHLVSYCLTIGVGYLIVILVPRLGANSLMTIDHLAAFGLVPMMLVYQFVRDRIDVKTVANLAGGLVILGIVGLFLLPAVGIEIPMTYKFLKVLNPFTSTDNALYLSVAENKVIAWASLFNDFGTITILAVVGTYFSVKSQSDKNIYASVFFLTALYFAGVMARLSQVLAAPACVMGAYGLVEIARPFIGASVQEEESRGKRKEDRLRRQQDHGCRLHRPGDPEPHPQHMERRHLRRQPNQPCQQRHPLHVQRGVPQGLASGPGVDEEQRGRRRGDLQLVGLRVLDSGHGREDHHGGRGHPERAPDQEHSKHNDQAPERVHTDTEEVRSRLHSCVLHLQPQRPQAGVAPGGQQQVAPDGAHRGIQHHRLRGLLQLRRREAPLLRDHHR
jgi:hypothetical protein